VILDDLRGRVAELEALVPRLFSVIAEKDAIIAELTATVKVTQGTRGETGERWCERAWTAVMTCRKQGGRPSSSSARPCGPIPTTPPRRRY
ncbi:MAG: hypothetical protein J6333_12880, partial [Planctomycetes bacterium]|nr:hypothetical protein [Planctomycetota bacterium]